MGHAGLARRDSNDRSGSIGPLQRPLLGPESWALRLTAGLRTVPYRKSRPEVDGGREHMPHY
jgi:hypothetical protein